VGAILFIVLVILLLGSSGRHYGFNLYSRSGVGGVLALILVVLVVLLFLGVLGGVHVSHQ